MRASIILVFLLLAVSLKAQKGHRATFEEPLSNYNNFKKIEGKTLALYVPDDQNKLRKAFLKSFEDYWTHSKVVLISDAELAETFVDTNFYLASFLRVLSDREEGSGLSKTVNYFAISYSNGYANSPEDYSATTIAAMRLSGEFPGLITSDEFSHEPFSVLPITDMIVKHLNGALIKFSEKAEFISEEILDFGALKSKNYGNWDIQGDLVFKPQKLIGKTLLFPKYAVSTRFNIEKFVRLSERRFGLANVQLVESPEEMEQLIKGTKGGKDLVYFMIRNDLLLDGCQEYGSAYDIADGEFVGHLTAPRIRNRPLSYFVTWITATTAIWSTYFGTIYLLGGFD